MSRNHYHSSCGSSFLKLSVRSILPSLTTDRHAMPSLLFPILLSNYICNYNRKQQQITYVTCMYAKLYVIETIQFPSQHANEFKHARKKTNKTKQSTCIDKNKIKFIVYHVIASLQYAITAMDTCTRIILRNSRGTNVEQDICVNSPALHDVNFILKSKDNRLFHYRTTLLVLFLYF